MSLPTRIFGYEPAAIGALLQGLLPLLVFVHWIHLSSVQLGLLAAASSAIVALYVAVSTVHTTLAVIVGVVQAGIALAVGFGAGISGQEAAAIIGATGIIFGFFNRQATVPLAKRRAVA